MGRGLLLATCVLTACVGTNPAWDGPVDDASESSQTGDRVGTGSGSSEGTTTLADGAETLASEATGIDGTASDTSSDDTTASTTEPMACAEGEQICDGICTDVTQDKHACSIYCLDCTVVFGNNARCEDGLCRYGGPGGGGPDGGGPGGG